ncbi:MAG: asparagine synthase C-terminal domain-containing protein, partial [Candidatus Eisenbacteria bacterium]|nr:asparagine synthase C-terminal domain-containing protein [Candidatus Eisenbacteria bacterium]
RMLMAHSVEGRFPFLDPNVTTLANSLPDTYKLHVLDEKHILKRAAAGLVPRVVRWRKKQPYRAPDALSFIEEKAPEWVDMMMSEEAVRKAGIFDPIAVGRLWKKCRTAERRGPFSNSDNMAVVGVLSTQLLHDRYIRQSFNDIAKIQLQTMVDHVEKKVGP